MASDEELAALVAKIRVVIDPRRLPKVLVDAYVVLGGDRNDLNRLCQIMADNFAEGLLSEIDFWGPFDDSIKEQIRQRIVDRVAKKFDEITA